MFSWHSPVSIIGGFLIGFGILQSFKYLGWWGLATLPIWAIVFLYVLLVPYKIDEVIVFKKARKRMAEKAKTE